MQVEAGEYSLCGRMSLEPRHKAAQDAVHDTHQLLHVQVVQFQHIGLDTHEHTHTQTLVNKRIYDKQINININKNKQRYKLFIQKQTV